MMGWELSVATPFTIRQDSTENTTTACVLTVSLQVETYCQGPQCFGLQVSCSDTRHGWPQAPACSGTERGSRGRFAEQRTQRRQRTARAGCERQQETEAFQRRLCRVC